MAKRKLPDDIAQEQPGIGSFFARQPKAPKLDINSAPREDSAQKPAGETQKSDAAAIPAENAHSQSNPNLAKPSAGSVASTPAATDQKASRHTGTASTHEKHHWRTGWNEDFPWVCDSKQGMTCSWCKSYWQVAAPAVSASSTMPAKLNVFITSPCITYRRQMLTAHEQEPFHKLAESAHKLASAQPTAPPSIQRTPEEQAMLCMFEKAVATNRAALSQIITALYWLTKEAVAQVPFSTFSLSFI